ncbi:bifunctional folylpolyglutamate synthase/dihydrofolate synthase, partial [Bacillus cereus]|nr:bifunctional folylpolyglutamate synthase/dihydrofolate synthase [Bacillus cereus]
KESKLVIENWKEAIDTKVEMIAENDVFIITGSLYFISEVRKYIREKN